MCLWAQRIAGADKKNYSKMMDDKEKIYRCKDCGKIAKESERLRIPSLSDKNRILYKCPKCRGRLIELEDS